MRRDVGRGVRHDRDKIGGVPFHARGEHDGAFHPLAQLAQQRGRGSFREHRQFVNRLVIDDEAAVLASLSLVIESWGYGVLTATSEDEAVEVLSRQSHPPDIIIADYRLRAGRTGAQAINRIWELFSHKIPSIIITGDTAPERIREAEAHGLTILHKPMQPARMKAVIADIIG